MFVPKTTHNAFGTKVHLVQSNWVQFHMSNTQTGTTNYNSSHGHMTLHIIPNFPFTCNLQNKEKVERGGSTKLGRGTEFGRQFSLSIQFPILQKTNFSIFVSVFNIYVFYLCLCLSYGFKTKSKIITNVIIFGQYYIFGSECCFSVAVLHF